MAICNSIEQRVADFVTVCRQRGLKATHQRVEIYRELVSTTAHPDAETLYRRVRRRVPSISLDTVYRTLRMLESKHMIGRIGPASGRTRFDANTGTHHHFICSTCGRVEDVCCSMPGVLAPPANVLARGKVASVHIEFRGTCRQCAGQPQGLDASVVGSGAHTQPR